jgi:hypothetical protein
MPWSAFASSCISGVLALHESSVGVAARAQVEVVAGGAVIVRREADAARSDGVVVHADARLVRPRKKLACAVDLVVVRAEGEANSSISKSTSQGALSGRKTWPPSKMDETATRRSILLTPLGSTAMTGGVLRSPPTSVPCLSS